VTFRFAACALAAATLVAGARPARAQRGIDTETFRPALDSYGIFTVERAETGKQWDFGFKLFVDFAYRPLRLDMKDATGMPQHRVPLMDFQAAMHLGGHLSFTDWLELALEIPVSAQSNTAAYGTPEPDGPGGTTDPLHPTGFYASSGHPTNVGPPDAAPLDARVALKARTRRFGPLGLALVVAVTIPFGDDTAFLGDSGFTFRPAAVIDLAFGRFALALNLGYILRQRTVVLDPSPVVPATPYTLIELRDELTTSLGASYRLSSIVGLAAEAYALTPLTGGPRGIDDMPTPGRTPVPADYVLDVLGGLQLFPGRDLTIALGAGAGVLDSQRHDAFRVFAGLSWAPVEAGRASVGGVDSDGDGIPDGADLCPKEPEDKDGFDDEDGCPDPDNDQDGIPDDRDKCPNDPEDKDGFQDDDGCPELDNDGDGIPDAQDKCPNEPEDKDGFQDDDGCPDPDNDGDGIPDDKDKCPNEPETKNGVDDDDGCPDSGGAVQIGSGKVEIPDQIQFETGRATILPRSYALLDRIAQKLKENPAIRRVRVEGHTDNQGGADKNQSLSQARADAVIDYLSRRGVDGSRLQGVGYGATRPIATNATAGGRAKNRRVEFIIVEQQ
jgi:outer membrane protein OmpA-like peptidoglycan-associated protein